MVELQTSFFLVNIRKTGQLPGKATSSPSYSVAGRNLKEMMKLSPKLVSLIKKGVDFPDSCNCACIRAVGRSRLTTTTETSTSRVNMITPSYPP